MPKIIHPETPLIDALLEAHRSGGILQVKDRQTIIAPTLLPGYALATNSKVRQ